MKTINILWSSCLDQYSLFCSDSYLGNDMRDVGCVLQGRKGEMCGIGQSVTDWRIT